MKADQLIPGNWYYHNDVLVKFIFHVTTDKLGYRFERAVGRTYCAFSLNADRIEKEITHELKFVVDMFNGCDLCCLKDSDEECRDAGNCTMLHREDKKNGYYIKSEIKS